MHTFWERMNVSAVNVKIQYFFKIVFLHLYCGRHWHNQSSKGILVCKFPYFRKYSKITNIWWPKAAFLQLGYYIFQNTDSTSKISSRIVDCVIIHQNIDFKIAYFPKKYLSYVFCCQSFYSNSTHGNCGWGQNRGGKLISRNAWYKDFNTKGKKMNKALVF